MIDCWCSTASASSNPRHDYQSEQLGWSVGGQSPEALTQRVLTRLLALKVSSLFSQQSLASSDFARAGSSAAE